MKFKTRKRRLYFKCDEKCIGILFQKVGTEVITVLDKEIGVNIGDELREQDNIREVEMKQTNVAISSVVGLTLPKTMKVLGELKGQKVNVLVDSDTSHNFVFKTLVEQWINKWDTTHKYMAVVRNKEKLKGQGLLKGLDLKVQGLEIREDFLPMDLGSIDVILEA